MKFLDALLARFGYVKIAGYGLVLAPSGRIISLNGRVIDDDEGTAVGWRDDGAPPALPAGGLGDWAPHPATTSPGTRARATTAELDDLDWQQAVARARAGQDPYPIRAASVAPMPPALAAAVAAHGFVPPAIAMVAAPTAVPSPPPTDAWAAGTGTTATGEAFAIAPTTVDDNVPPVPLVRPAPIVATAPRMATAARELPRVPPRATPPIGLAAPATLVQPTPAAPARQRSGTLPGTQTAPVRTVAPMTAPRAPVAPPSAAAIARVQLAKTPAIGIPRLSQHRPPAKQG